MNPDIGTSQRCLKGQVTPEHQGLGTGVRQQWDNSGVLHWFLRLQHSPSPNLVLDVLEGLRYVSLSLCFAAPTPFPVCLSLPVPPCDLEVKYGRLTLSVQKQSQMDPRKKIF